jgi:IclR family acetate operon transcriptional repressor
MRKSRDAGSDLGESRLPSKGGTPALRLFSLLECIASHDQLLTLQDLVGETGLPKPTVHRMLQQLEHAELVVRQDGGREYGTGPRLRQMAEQLLLNDTHHAARHTVLRDVVTEIGESCNITALAKGEVVYLDRVETAEPLRFLLRAGSRVPAHASASGKMIMSQLSRDQRDRLLGPGSLQRYSPNTITDREVLEDQCQRIRRDGFALDDEEYLPGLVCIAVLVPTKAGRSNTCLAAQAPVVRMNTEQALELLPALERAARAISDI